MSDDDKKDAQERYDSAAPLDPLHPKNLKTTTASDDDGVIASPSKRKVAVAITGKSSLNDPTSLTPSITASGYGYISEQIMQLAFENDVRVREDSDLAELLAYLDQDSPIPVEAIEAIAEILSYVYRANGAPNPFDAILNHAMEGDEKKSETSKSETSDGYK